MKTSSLEILENAELSPAQAYAILKVMEMEIASTHESLSTRADLVAVEAQLEAKIEGKIGGLEGRLTRWVFTCILGQTAVLAGLGYFALTHLK